MHFISLLTIIFSIVKVTVTLQILLVATFKIPIQLREVFLHLQVYHRIQLSIFSYLLIPHLPSTLLTLILSNFLLKLRVLKSMFGCLMMLLFSRGIAKLV